MSERLGRRHQTRTVVPSPDTPPVPAADEPRSVLHRAEPDFRAPLDRQAHVVVVVRHHQSLVGLKAPLDARRLCVLERVHERLLRIR